MNEEQIVTALGIALEGEDCKIYKEETRESDGKRHLKLYSIVMDCELDPFYVRFDGDGLIEIRQNANDEEEGWYLSLDINELKSLISLIRKADKIRERFRTKNPI